MNRNLEICSHQKGWTVTDAFIVEMIGDIPVYDCLLTCSAGCGKQNIARRLGYVETKGGPRGLAFAETVKIHPEGVTLDAYVARNITASIDYSWFDKTPRSDPQP